MYSATVSRVRAILTVCRGRYRLAMSRTVRLPPVSSDGFDIGVSMAISSQVSTVHNGCFATMFNAAIKIFTLGTLTTSSSAITTVINDSTFLKPTN